LIRVEAMRDSLERIGRFDPDRARARFLDRFEPGSTWAIEMAGESVGFFEVTHEEGVMLLDHLYVRPEFQGKHIGSAVLDHLFAEADIRRCDIRVGALRDSDSNRFYLRHGFVLVEVAEHDNYYVRRAPSAC
jgi:GNAT superfamily N-acetyltransferase